MVVLCLINSCGNLVMSEDVLDILLYFCKEDDKVENFII